MGIPVVVVPPVRPAALLSHILERCAHPTTLVICSTSTNFVKRCADDADNDDTDGSVLHTASLLQVAVARHIRVAFVPTVAHLRGFLAALDLRASRVPAPPAADVLLSSGGAPPSVRRGDHSLVVYGFLRVHRDTSEWSSQGLSASAAVLVEAGWRTGLDVLVVDGDSSSSGEGTMQTTALDEKMPVLSTGPRRQLQKAGYPLRTERIRAVLSRWFSFRETLEAPIDERPEVEDKTEEEQPVPQRESTAEPAVIEEVAETEDIGEADEVEVIAVEEKEAGTMEVEDALQDEPHIEETIRVAEEKPRKTFVKDSEDEDDDLSDDDTLYP